MKTAIVDRHSTHIRLPRTHHVNWSVIVIWAAAAVFWIGLFLRFK